jgi:hypothetical protein
MGFGPALRLLSSSAMKGSDFVPYTRRGFSPGQQGHYRPLVEAAWNRYCQLARLPESPPDKKTNATFRRWYEAELEIATGKTSTEHCDRKRDFTKAMAHFETIAQNGIYWNTRLYGDDARRVAWNIREVCRTNEVDDTYMRAMARNALQLADDDPLPDLERLDYKLLLVIMGELKRWLRRDPGSRPRGNPNWVTRGEEPF